VLALTWPSTGGDRGTANSVGSCSRQAAGLANAQRSASFASERARSAKIGARNKTTNARARAADCFSFPHFRCAPSHPFFPTALRWSALSRRKFTSIRTCPVNARSFILGTYPTKSGYFLLFSLRHRQLDEFIMNRTLQRMNLIH